MPPPPAPPPVSQSTSQTPPPARSPLHLHRLNAQARPSPPPNLQNGKRIPRRPHARHCRSTIRAAAAHSARAEGRKEVVRIRFGGLGTLQTCWNGRFFDPRERGAALGEWVGGGPGCDRRGWLSCVRREGGGGVGRGVVIAHVGSETNLSVPVV